MAEGLARHIWGDRVTVSSAGSLPTRVNPLAIRVMAEIGIDISNQRSTSVNEVDASAIDLVITLCADEVCPIVLCDAARLHWPLDDPDKGQMRLSEAQRLEYFRVARDEIARRIRGLISVSADSDEGLGMGVGR